MWSLEYEVDELQHKFADSIGENQFTMERQREAERGAERDRYMKVVQDSRIFIF